MELGRSYIYSLLICISFNYQLKRTRYIGHSVYYLMVAKMKIETEYTNDKSKIKPARLTIYISKIWTKLIERMKYKLKSCK